ARGSRPTKDQRPHLPPWSTDSSRNPGRPSESSPQSRMKAATGVVMSARRVRHTGTTRCDAARRWKVARSGDAAPAASRSATEGPEEAGVLAGVARTPALLLHLEQQRVAVAVVPGPADELPVARGVALAPHLLARARPEHGPTLLEAHAEGLRVHPRHHQHVPAPDLLHDRGDEPVGVVADAVEVLLADLDRCHLRGFGHGGHRRRRPGGPITGTGRCAPPRGAPTRARARRARAG